MSRFSFVRRRGGRLLMALSVLLVTLWTTSLAATVVIYLDLGRLVELSDVIVQGHVVDQTSYEDAKTQKPFTLTTVKVEHAFLGDVGPTVQFRQWGGEIGGIASHIPGDAQFDGYEEVVVFLDDGEGEYAGMRYLTALGQAKYSVVRDGDAALVVRDLRTTAFYDPESTAISKRGRETYTLDAFVPELEALVAAIKGGTR